MQKLSGLQPQRVLEIFEELSSIPRGSGNTKGIADFCVEYAKKLNLKYIRDNADNVIVFKDGNKCGKNAKPVILQGHLDMVCQKTEESSIDFLKDGLDLYVDGDYLKARGTTLGGDNGIAVAMVFAILESNDLVHPPIEAVFTSDEEIGMLGATVLDTTPLKSKLMINLDSEEDDVMTVSCAGGREVSASFVINTENKCGTKVVVDFKGLKGGHSGVEINSGRVNSNVLASRFLNHMKKQFEFDLISIGGGDKSNAIPNRTVISLLLQNAHEFKKTADEYLTLVKSEISSREEDFAPEVLIEDASEYQVFSKEDANRVINAILLAPNGIIEMSREIEGLVETSLNLGILKYENGTIFMQYALRSNKMSALDALEEKLCAYFDLAAAKTEVSGHYPPWEFKDNSLLQKLYIETYLKEIGFNVKVEAIHAGLECGIFSSKIEGLDCIAIGPSLFDVHTVNEKLSISSLHKFFSLLSKVLEKLA